MNEIDYIGFLVLIPFFISLGVIVGYLLHDEINKVQIHSLAPRDTDLPDDTERAPMHTPEEDLGLINSEGVGIVYRPSVDELVQMNESDKVKQAKQAMTETIQNASPVEL